MASTPRPGLTLHTSNRLERLADQLAEILADPLSSPLLPEIVVVQSNGMRRWLEDRCRRGKRREQPRRRRESRLAEPS